MISQVVLDRILPTVTKPTRYAGQEWNQVRKDWSQTEIKVALAYPDVYEVGMSNLGLAILYDLLNQQPDVLAERVYAPWLDMERAMRQAGLSLFSLESRHSLREFDIVGFSLQYELNYSNLLNMLDLAGVPLLASQRDGGWPLIVGGGTCTYNAEPLADFFDLFVIGEGEQVLLELVALYADWKDRIRSGAVTKAEFLHQAAAVEGVYVPSLYRAEYNEDGTTSAIVSLDPSAPARIRKRILCELPPPPVKPVVPFLKVIHDRGMIEIMRGCTRGCRFCQAGMIYRPVRERPMDQVLAAVDRLLANTGYEEIALVSLSSTDYVHIEPLIRELSRRYAERRLSISLPSMRTDAFSVELAQIIQRTRKTGLTFAPEAGSERLRQVINKGVTADDLLRTAEAAYASGWLRIKLYFMIGLPTETMEDVLAIADLVKEVRKIGRRLRGKRAQVSVSVASFIPKAHTPFQWVALQDPAQIAEKQNALRRELPGRGVRLSWSDEATTWLEAALSRGDRRLGPVILRAWQLGARFDAWTEAYEPELWERAFAEADLDPKFYAARQRSYAEVLPWEHIDTGVDQSSLWEEYQRALRGEPSISCAEGCMNCGVQAAFNLAHCPPATDAR
ncbi:MAG: radical SAM protein [Anaerolineae bacterium SM23_84]|nr:MAG: radical SAM protein [Anaerolineae bacterium SM23_84]